MREELFDALDVILQIYTRCNKSFKVSSANTKWSHAWFKPDSESLVTAALVHPTITVRTMKAVYNVCFVAVLTACMCVGAAAASVEPTGNFVSWHRPNCIVTCVTRMMLCSHRRKALDHPRLLTLLATSTFPTATTHATSSTGAPTTPPHESVSAAFG